MAEVQLSSCGNVRRRKGPPDPKKRLIGLKAAASPKHFSNTTVHTSHLGYACYATGPINTTGKIRIIMRAARLPPNISADLQMMLPVEMWWPERDHAAAHALIDAIMTFDFDTLATWKSMWPNHDFGFERFVQLSQRHIAQVNGEKSISNLPGRRNQHGVQKAALPKQALFPSPVSSVEKIGTFATAHDALISTALVRFVDGLNALRVTLRSPPLSDERLLLSRVYVDLIDGQYEVVEHYPGRLRAMGIPEDTILGIIGVRPEKLVRKVAPRPKDPEKPNRFSTMKAALPIQAQFLSGDPHAEVERTSPAPISHTDDDFHPIAFPDAPAPSPWSRAPEHQS